MRMCPLLNDAFLVTFKGFGKSEAKNCGILRLHCPLVGGKLTDIFQEVEGCILTFEKIHYHKARLV